MTVMWADSGNGGRKVRIAMPLQMISNLLYPFIEHEDQSSKGFVSDDLNYNPFALVNV